MRILIVDDETAILDALTSILGAEGHAISCANSGPAALEMLHTAKTPFQLVITDQTMVGMSGKELANEWKKRSPSTLIALLTGLSAADTASDLPPNIDYVLSKPIRLAALRKFVGECAAR
jgi:DNA-binding response OmpR family regulator